jgi:hypothetical protein
MKKNLYRIYALVILLTLGPLTACEEESQIFGWRSGSELLIKYLDPDAGWVDITTGELEVDLDDEITFAVAGFSNQEDYSWDVSGATSTTTPHTTDEFIDVEFLQTGTVTISVQNTKYTGDITVTVN